MFSPSRHLFSRPAVLSLLSLAFCSPAALGQFDRAVKLGNVSDEKLNEISGMIVSRRDPGILWVHNDGGKATLSAVRTNGQVLASFRLRAAVSDAEGMAVGPGAEQAASFLYLGDIGDNDAERENIRVFRFPEPLVSEHHQAGANQSITSFETFILKYPDGAHDAEALMIDPETGDLIVATKEKRRSRLYAAKQEQLAHGGTATLVSIGEVPFGPVSAGDISPDGREIILRREDAAWLWLRADGENIQAAFQRSPVSAPVVGPPQEPNGESIAFDSAGSAYYTISEGKNPAIYFFRRQAGQSGW